MGDSLATILIVEQRGANAWRWRFEDERGRFEAEVEFEVDAPDNQVLIERAAPVTTAPPGPALRAELIRCMKTVLGEREVNAIASSPATRLHVKGTRANHVALSLPYELLFHPEEPGRVIRQVAPPGPSRPGAPPPEMEERLFAAFALHSDDPFLPLHAEASVLGSIAAEAEIPYDELFLGFTAEDVLGAGPGASIVHLTGHGGGGKWRCHRRLGEATELTSGELIDAWRLAPPRLFVLDFCESSSEDSLRELAEASMSGLVALHEYSLQVFSFEQSVPSSSIALDLTSALPTAALALRTAADDTEAREFVAAFYRAHLVDRLPLEDAFAVAVAERGFYDDTGLLVPCLFVSSEQPESARGRPELPRRPSPRRALSEAQRRCLNGYYKAVGPFGTALEMPRICSLTGEIGDSQEALVDSLDAMSRNWAVVCGKDPPPPPRRTQLSPGHRTVEWTPSEGDGIACLGFDLECLPDLTAIGELLAHRRGVDFEDLLLIAGSTCNVPVIVQAMADVDIAALARRLREIAAGRSTIADRALQWELTSALIDHLPPSVGEAVRAWSDGKWEQVVSLGPMAIDIYASRFLLGEDAWVGCLRRLSGTRLTRCSS